MLMQSSQTIHPLNRGSCLLLRWKIRMRIPRRTIGAIREPSMGYIPDVKTDLSGGKKRIEQQDERG
jgi:hypothetical protein